MNKFLSQIMYNKRYIKYNESNEYISIFEILTRLIHDKLVNSKKNLLTVQFKNISYNMIYDTSSYLEVKIKVKINGIFNYKNFYIYICGSSNLSIYNYTYELWYKKDDLSYINQFLINTTNILNPSPNNYIHLTSILDIQDSKVLQDTCNNIIKNYINNINYDLHRVNECIKDDILENNKSMVENIEQIIYKKIYNVKDNIEPLIDIMAIVIFHYDDIFKIKIKNYKDFKKIINSIYKLKKYDDGIKQIFLSVFIFKNFKFFIKFMSIKNKTFDDENKNYKCNFNEKYYNFLNKFEFYQKKSSNNIKMKNKQISKPKIQNMEIENIKIPTLPKSHVRIQTKKNL